MSKVIVVTSGKGGVGKTTTSANIATGMAQAGFKTVAIDFDVGLRNLDLVMGCERRVVYDFVNVIRNEATLQQALIRDKRVETLYVLPASQTRDKDALNAEGVGRVIDELKEMGFDYIICDSPAGIEKGAQMAMYFADEAIVVTNPEVSSVRDSDRVLGLLAAKTSRAELGGAPIRTHLLLTRYSPAMVKHGEMLSVGDVLELLGIPLLGVIPESKAVLQSSNKGTPADPRRDHRRRAGLPGRRLPLPGPGPPAPLHRGREARLLRPAVRLTAGRYNHVVLRLLPEAAQDGVAGQGPAVDHRGARARRRRAGAPTTCRSSAGAAGGDRAYEHDRPANVTVNLDRTAAARCSS